MNRSQPRTLHKTSDLPGENLIRLLQVWKYIFLYTFWVDEFILKIFLRVNPSPKSTPGGSRLKNFEIVFFLLQIQPIRIFQVIQCFPHPSSKCTTGRIEPQKLQNTVLLFQFFFVVFQIADCFSMSSLSKLFTTKGWNLQHFEELSYSFEFTESSYFFKVSALKFQHIPMIKFKWDDYILFKI